MQAYNYTAAPAWPAKFHSTHVRWLSSKVHVSLLLNFAGLEAQLPVNINTLQDKAGTSSTPPPSSLSWATALSSISKPASEVALGHGILSLPKRMVEKMPAWEYIDLAELPPARAHVSKESLNATPNVLLIQSLESARSHRCLIPDITT